MKIKLSPLDKKLIPIDTRAKSDHESLEEFIELSVRFGCNPWSVVAVLWEGKIQRTSFTWLHDKLLHENLDDCDKHACLLVYRFLLAAYRFDVNPLSVLRKQLPGWHWLFHQKVKGWTIAQPKIFGNETPSSRTWTWVITDFMDGPFKITASSLTR